MIQTTPYALVGQSQTSFEARYDTGGAVAGLVGSLLLAAVCIWAGEHYALIGGLIGLVGIGLSVSRLCDQRVRLRIDEKGIHIPVSSSSIGWHEIEQVSWRVVTHGANRRTYVLLSLSGGREQEIELTYLNVSLEEMCQLLEHGV